MEINAVSKLIANKFLISTSSSVIDSILQTAREGSKITAIVMQKFSNSSEYLLNMKGKQVRFQSETNLLLGEKLELGIRKIGTQIEMEILSRSHGSREMENPEQNSGWSKSYFSVPKTIQQIIDPMKSEALNQKIMQFLDVYFPGIQWNEATEHFYWQFEDAEAEGFYGKAKDRYSFYFHYQSKTLGAIDSYFYSKKEDFSNFVLHSVFDNLSIYFLANENLGELKKMLSSNSISANDIIFHYSSVEKNRKGDWIV